jgi:PEP-CTERM motif
MTRAAFVITIAVIVAVCSVPSVEASSLLRIDVSGTSISCDNSTSAGVTSCTTAGFNTVLGSNAITFTGNVNGVSFGGGGITGVQMMGNQPGSMGLAFVLDSKTALNNLSGSLRVVTVDYGGNGFTQPVGTGFLSAAQTANWTSSTAGDSQAFTAWQRNDNALIIPGAGVGGATDVSPNCVSPGGLSRSCSEQTLNVPASPASPYAVTGREVISMSAGTVASYTATAGITAQPIGVPEPNSLVLLGTGVLMLAGYQWRGRRK